MKDLCDSIRACWHEENRFGEWIKHNFNDLPCDRIGDGDLDERFDGMSANKRKNDGKIR